jgi:hypothetical protein
MGEGAILLCVMVTSRSSPERPEENCEESKDSQCSDSGLVPVELNPDVLLESLRKQFCRNLSMVHHLIPFCIWTGV